MKNKSPVIIIALIALAAIYLAVKFVVDLVFTLSVFAVIGFLSLYAYKFLKK